MSDPIATPFVPATPPAASATPPTAPPAAAPVSELITLTPAQFKKRLEEESAAAIRRVGFKDAAEAAEIKAAADRAADEKKSAEQRAADARAAYEQKDVELAKHVATIREHAARQMIGLTAEQTKAVKDIAGDDANMQLRAIAALQPTWAQAAPPAVPAPAPAPQAPAASTAQPRGAPTEQPAIPPNHRVAYEASRDKNPFAAAEYGHKNPAAYDTPK